jgi:DNA repair ATPase RecN
MKTKRKESWLASSLVTALLVGILTTVPAGAEVSEDIDNGHPQVADQLTSFKQTALEMQRHADRLDSMRFTRQLDWRTHADSLTILKEQVNQLGRTLTDLEELKPQANEGQRLAIENARPHLVGVAQEVTRAIDLLSEDRKSVYQPPYTDTVGNLYNHAASLYETVDSIMDYENARIRLLNLDLPPSSEGS